MELLGLFFIFLFGLCIGSFLNVVIFRLEKEEEIVKKRSYCPRCNQPLAWHDLVPLISFLWLRGRCRSCGKKISYQYPAVELATGISFLLVFWNLGFGFWDLFGYWPLSIDYLMNISCWLFFISCLMVIFVYDLKHYLIPDKVLFPAIGLAIFWRIFLSLEIGRWSFVAGNFLPYLVSALGAFVFFLLIFLITRGQGMGFGDVKLVFFLGLLVGWPNILSVLFLAFFIGAVAGILAIFFRGKNLKSQIPFGPFLIIATVFVIFFGEKFGNWYFSLLGF